MAHWFQNHSMSANCAHASSSVGAHTATPPQPHSCPRGFSTPCCAASSRYAFHSASQKSILSLSTIGVPP